MCKVGDIILIDNYIDNGNVLSRHSFVVVNDEAGEISGLPYDFVSNVLSSFKDENQKVKKLTYPGNFSFENSDTITNPNNGKDGYVKTDQLYYFNKSKIKYKNIGNFKKEVIEAIIKFVEDGDFPLQAIIDNL